MPANEAQKTAFTKALNSLTGQRRAFEVFQDWAEMAAIAMHQLPYQSGMRPKDEAFQALESQFLSVQEKYTPAEFEVFGQMLGMVMIAYEEPGDFLGEIYQEMGFSNERTGQFFTPYALNQAMAAMTLPDLPQRLQAKPLLTIADPACGSGGAFIAVLEHASRQGVDFRQVLQFYGTDVDRTCFNMAYIQLSVLGAQAEITHGNSLSQEKWESRPTPQLQFYRDWQQEQFDQQMADRMLALIKGMVTPENLTPDVDEIAAAALAEELQAEQPAPAPDIVLEPRQLGLFDEHTPEP